MTTASQIEGILSAYIAMRHAMKAYADAVDESIPNGTVVELKHGNNWIGPYVVKGSVGSWSSRPGELNLFNPRTGKYKWAAPCSIRVLEVPGDE